MVYKMTKRVNPDTIRTRILEPNESDAKILGPGSMQLSQHPINGLLSPQSKKQKLEVTSDGPSLNEMLTEKEKSIKENFSENLSEERSAQVFPSSDCLSNLLVQGLQSKDRRMLNTVLCRGEPTVIKNTLKALPNDQIEPLLRELNQMLFQKGDQNLASISWLEMLCRSKLSLITTSQGIQQLLQKISQLIGARCEIFDRMYKLKGRLNLLDCQVNKSSDFDKDDAQFTYQESSSDDEEPDDKESENNDLFQNALDGKEASDRNYGNSSDDEYEENDNDDVDVDSDASCTSSDALLESDMDNETLSLAKKIMRDEDSHSDASENDGGGN